MRPRAGDYACFVRCPCFADVKSSSTAVQFKAWSRDPMADIKAADVKMSRIRVVVATAAS